jgi:hypothetical protein
MAKFDGGKEEWSSIQHALAYLDAADNLPLRAEGEAYSSPGIVANSTESGLPQMWILI